MPNDKVGGFLASCAILLVVILYVVSFERVTCSPTNQRGDQSINVNSLTPEEKRRTLVITVDVTRLSPEQIQNVRIQLRQEMICNLKRVRNKPLPAYCYDTTTTTASVTTAMETTLESTTEIDTTTTEAQTTADLSTTTRYIPPELPSGAKRRKRNALGKDDGISDQNLQSHHIHFGPDADPDVKRKRRQASVETDCEDLLLLSDDGQNANDSSLEFYIVQRDDCSETDAEIIGALRGAAQTTNDTGRFDAKTNATILRYDQYRSDIPITYIITEETTITTAIITTQETTTAVILTTEETTITTDILTTEETTITTDILTTEETTITTDILTTEETTITTDTLTTTAGDNIVTTYESTNPSTGWITITDNATSWNSIIEPTVSANHEVWIPILIALIVLSIFFITLFCCHQKGKKQRPGRRPRPETQASPPSTSQQPPSDASNGPGPPATTNGSPRQLDDSKGYLIPDHRIGVVSFLLIPFQHWVDCLKEAVTRNLLFDRGVDCRQRMGCWN